MGRVFGPVHCCSSKTPADLGRVYDAFATVCSLNVPGYGGASRKKAERYPEDVVLGTTGAPALAGRGEPQRHSVAFHRLLGLQLEICCN